MCGRYTAVGKTGHEPVLGQIRRRKWNWLGHTIHKDSITKQALHKATAEDDGQELLGKEIWRKKCGQQDTSIAGGRWRQQHKTELDGDKTGLWPMFHRERRSILSQVSQVKIQKMRHDVNT